MNCPICKETKDDDPCIICYECQWKIMSESFQHEDIISLKTIRERKLSGPELGHLPMTLTSKDYEIMMKGRQLTSFQCEHNDRIKSIGTDKIDTIFVYLSKRSFTPIPDIYEGFRVIQQVIGDIISA